MKTLSIICSLANTSDDKSSKNIHQPINIMYNSLYMLNLSHKKTKAIATLDVQIYKAYECKHINDDEKNMRLKDICDTIHDIHEINKKNNLYKLFDDEIISIN